MRLKISHKRFLILNILILAVFPVIIFQLFQLTVRNQEFLVKRAKLQHDLLILMEPDRGIILDRNEKPFATNLKVPSIYAVPRSMSAEERERLAPRLANILTLSESFVRDRLDRNKAFIWLKRHVTEEEAEKVQALKSKQLGARDEMRRFYPHGSMLANLIGYCDIDNVGVEGLELIHQKQLKGRAGYRRTKRDARGRELVALEEKIVPVVNGANLILTIDQYIQHLTEEALTQAFEKWKAKSATAVVMNPKTGEILAMATRPSYDPNTRSLVEADVRRNRPITDIFEPGSVFKMVTLSSALNEGVVSLQDEFDCEHGEWQVRRGRTIHDVHPHGMLSFSQVLIKSSNIGTVKIAQKLGERKLHDYIRKFGFGQRTGIDFPGEVVGILRPVEKWSKYSITSIPYGQEVAATSIQMLRAFSVLANDGRLAQPHFLKEIQDEHGVTLLENKPSSSDPILNPEVVSAMKGILTRVVEEGTGKRARIEGVRVAGKTGTTQKLDRNGGYSHDHFVGSFVGFAPAEDPMLSMIVSIDDPSPYYYGGTVAAPVFQEVIRRSLLYLGHVPSGKESGAISKAFLTAVGNEDDLRENRPPPLRGAHPQVR